MKNSNVLDRIIVIIPVFRVKKTRYNHLVELASKFAYTIIIDDSGEFDENLNEMLKDKSIKYIANKKELGLSKTVNKGIIEAQKLGAEWILLLNEDNEITDNEFLGPYLQYIEENSTLGVAALCPEYNYDRHRREKKNGYKDVKYSDMTGCLLSVAAINSIGLYDERFYIDGLDTEWCLRARKMGYRIIRCNEALLNHHPGETRELTICGHVVLKYGWHSPVRYYYQFMAIFLVHRLYHDVSSDIFGLYKIIKSLVLFPNNKEYFRMLKKAYQDYCRGYYGKYS